MIHSDKQRRFNPCNARILTLWLKVFSALRTDYSEGKFRHIPDEKDKLVTSFMSFSWVNMAFLNHCHVGHHPRKG